jgi:glyoxylase-like metal-dependent hydrolase (beta-lactamase superfamily II)
MKVAVTPVTPFQQNCSLVWCERTLRGAIIDPGGDLDTLGQLVEENGLNLEKILLTHAHIDHAGAADQLAQEFNIPIEGPHVADQFWIDSLPEQSQRFGFPPARAFTPSRWLAQGDEVTFGDDRMEVYHCPGHTPGHVVFFHRAAKLAFVGDVLFRGSIGRTDFPRGDHATLIRSITERLWPLGNDVSFVPGHGPMSTFGEERQSNPFVADRLSDQST